jgi:Flp pilus assembly protein TadG
MQPVTNERGSVIVFITLMVVILMVMVGIGLDTGQITYSRNLGQAAVDAAALSAVSGLPSRNATEIANRAIGYNGTNDYMGGNNIKAANVTYVKYDYTTNTITYDEPLATANGVRVALEGADAISTRTFLTPMMRMFGASVPTNQNISVSAVATIQSRPAIPIALWETKCGTKVGTPPAYPLQPNGKIEMQHPDQNDATGENACWTTFFDCSSGAPDIKAGFVTAGTCSGSSIDGNVGIGSMICQNRGQVNTVLGGAEDFFLKTPSNVGKWFIIPVLSGGGNCAPDNPTGIVDFAKIKVSAIDKTGNPKYITADIQCGQSLDSTESSLCFTHRLVRENTPLKDKGY